jgi:hypothetical protein
MYATIANLPIPNSAAGWTELAEVADSLPTSTLLDVCQWNDPNGDWFDPDDVPTRAEMLQSIRDWARELGCADSGAR